MKERYLHIIAKFGVMESELAVVKIAKFAELVTASVLRVCPKCKEKPDYVNSFYKCKTCGDTFGHWSALEAVDPITKQPIPKERLQAEDSDVKAYITLMTLEEFGKQTCDAMLSEMGVTLKEDQYAINLRNLLIATHSLNYVAILRFNDTYEQRITLLTINLSGRVVIREIIPKNLAEISDTLKVDFSKVTPEELAQAEALIKMIPKATEETLVVTDWRTKGTLKPKVSGKTEDFEAIYKRVIAQQGQTTAPTQQVTVTGKA
jgi:hypothetical protein